MIKVGDRFKNTKGSEYVVVDYKNHDNITVEFCDKHKYITTRGHRCVKTGNIKNPFQPLLFGIGYFGLGSHKSKSGTSRGGFETLPAYSAWTNMLSRCYDKNYITPHLYEYTTIHKDWHCFQNFADWYTSELKYTGWDDRTCLDKDVIGNGYIYSENTCCLIPACINSIITNRQGGKYLTGVRKASDNVYRVVPGYSCSNIRFDNEEAAHLAFVEVKVEKIKQLASSYQKFLRSDVYETLMEKDYRYKFSPFFEKEKSSHNLSN